MVEDMKHSVGNDQQWENEADQEGNRRFTPQICPMNLSEEEVDPWAWDYFGTNGIRRTLTSHTYGTSRQSLFNLGMVLSTT